MTSDDPVPPATDDAVEPFGPCSSCGRDLWWTGQAPSMDGNAWICGECDAARNFDALDIQRSRRAAVIYEYPRRLGRPPRQHRP